MDLQMSLLQEETQYLKFVVDVLRNARLQEGDSFSKEDLAAIGIREGMHPYEIEKSLRLAREYGLIKFPTLESFVLTKDGESALH